MAFFKKIAGKLFSKFKSFNKQEDPFDQNDKGKANPQPINLPTTDNVLEATPISNETETILASFLNGQPVTVVSSNVSIISYDNENNILYIQFKNGNTYAYYDINTEEAKEFYLAPSKGTQVWDTLRVRGTIFGYKKEYALVDGISSKPPVYRERQSWSEEHGQIPPSGEIPQSWLEGKGPYSPGWLQSKQSGESVKTKGKSWLLGGEEPPRTSQ